MPDSIAPDHGDGTALVCRGAFSGTVGVHARHKHDLADALSEPVPSACRERLIPDGLLVRRQLAMEQRACLRHVPEHLRADAESWCPVQGMDLLRQMCRKGVDPWMHPQRRRCDMGHWDRRLRSAAAHDRRLLLRQLPFGQRRRELVRDSFADVQPWRRHGRGALADAVRRVVR